MQRYYGVRREIHHGRGFTESSYEKIEQRKLDRMVSAGKQRYQDNQKKINIEQNNKLYRTATS